MKAFVVVCLAIAGVSCEADADPYTIGQVLAGIPAAKTAYDGQTRILSVGNGPRTVYAGYRGNGLIPATSYVAAPVAAYNGHIAAPVAAYSSHVVAPAVTYANHVTGAHLLGKREAEAEAEAEPWTIAQVAAGVPLAKAAYEHRAPGHIAYTEYPSGVRVANPVVSYAATPVATYSAAAHTVATPVVSSYAGHHVSYPAATYGYPYGYHYLGKREAEAEPEAEPWTIGQVAAGLPLANAAAEHRAPGYIAYTSYPSTGVYAGHVAAPAVYRSHVAAPAVYRSHVYAPASTYGLYGAVYG